MPTQFDPPSGTRDFLAAEFEARERVFATIRAVFSRYGFEPLQTPAFERLDADARQAFLCVFAHDLTVAIRALLLDRPVAEADLDRVWKINEFMHQLTSCANPQGHWSAHDSAVLVGDIIETSFRYDLDRWVGHALATAAGNLMGKKESAAAK